MATSGLCLLKEKDDSGWRLDSLPVTRGVAPGKRTKQVHGVSSFAVPLAPLLQPF